MKIRITKKRSRVIMFAMPDIAFLLLIFLILTVAIDEYGEIELPFFSFTQETDFPETVSIIVNRSGMIDVHGRQVETGALFSALSEIPLNTVIHIYADQETEYVVVDTVLNALKEVGLRDVVLIAETKDDT